MSEQLLRLSPYLNPFDNRMEGKLPTVDIKSIGQRTDSTEDPNGKPPVVTEFEEYGGYKIIYGANGSPIASAGITIAVAPHLPTTETTHIQTGTLVHFIGETTAREPQLPSSLEGINRLPPHLLVWLTGIENDNGNVKFKRMNTIDFTKLSPTERQPYFELLEDRIKYAVQAMIHSANISPGNRRYIEIGWLAGIDTKRPDGLGAGVQSHPYFHLSVFYANPNGYLEEIDIDQSPPIKRYLKQIDPWSSFLFNEFGNDIQNVILTSIANNFPERYNDKVTMNVDTGTNIQKTQAPNYEGYHISLHNGVPIREAMAIATQVVADLDHIYASVDTSITTHAEEQTQTTHLPLKILYEKLWNADSEEERNNILICVYDLCIEYGFSPEGAKKMQNFITKIQPTLGQLTRWNIETGQFSKEIQHINRRKDRNKSLDTDNVKSKNQRLHLLRHLLYGDRFATPDEYHTIEHTFAAHFSCSIMFSKFRIQEDGEIIVDEISISPRLVTKKGMAEDLTGCALNRAGRQESITK